MCPLLILGDLAPVQIDSILTDPAPPAALTLANLEIPLCAEGLSRRPKAGPALRGAPGILGPLTSVFPGLVVSLANNHMMDYGETGLAQTIEACTAARVPCFGAGANLTEASAELRLKREGFEIALLGACERQFGLATPTQAGVAHVSPALLARIRTLRDQVDRVIVSVHGGAEMSAWPAPFWQQTLRALAAAGAHIVHGHHPHIPQGFELWAGAWIFYGPGNTIVNPAAWPSPSATLRSWRFELDLHDLGKAPQVSEWSIVSPRPRTVELRSTATDAAHLAFCNSPLENPALLEGLWQEYATALWQSFYRPTLKPGFEATEVVAGIMDRLRSGLQALAAPARWQAKRGDRQRFLYHLFACEHHAEAIATALALRCGETPDQRTEETRRLHALLTA